MDTQYRLASLANEVQTVGVRGESMQAKLAELITAHDLSPNEIRRIAEMANRGTQEALFKVAVDKRFKFDLIDPAPLVKQAEKAAAESRFTGEGLAKTAALVAEAGGDPFAPLPPSRAATETLSLYNEPLCSKYAHDLRMTDVGKMIHKLETEHADYAAAKTAAKEEQSTSLGKANNAFDRAVQSASDLLTTGGIGLPNLYYAMQAAISGSKVPSEVVKSTDNFMLLVIDELLKRGVSKVRMGFKYRGDMAAIEKLSPEDLLALCKRACGKPYEGSITMETQKSAAVYIQHVQRNGSTKVPTGHPYEEAAKFMGLRPSVADDGVPSNYLDDKYNSNTPKGKPVAMNGDSEFIIAVKDLVGEQDRLVKIHSADEFIGLQLLQIQKTLAGLREARDESNAKFAGEVEASKEAWASLVAAGARALGGAVKSIPGAIKSIPGAIKGMSTGEKINAGVGVATVGAGMLPFVMKTQDAKVQERMSKQPSAPATP